MRFQPETRQTAVNMLKNNSEQIPIAAVETNIPFFSFEVILKMFRTFPENPEF